MLEALSATGLRSIRYAKEIPNIEYIVANDLDEEAVKSISRNAKHNQVPEGLIRPNQADAMFALLITHV